MPDDLPAASQRECAFSPSLPPELWQTVFRNLSLFDLVRCQRVCKTWNMRLPGNDPKLHEALFYRTGDAGPLKEDDLEIHLGLCGYAKSETCFLYVDIGSFSEAEREGFALHPMLKDLHRFAYILHPELSQSTRSNLVGDI